MPQEFEQAVLLIDLPHYGLQTGDVGTIVDITPNQLQLTLEFFNFSGDTIAVVALNPTQVRALQPQDIMHTRFVAMG
jgi:hypothetical protein